MIRTSIFEAFAPCFDGVSLDSLSYSASCLMRLLNCRNHGSFGAMLKSVSVFYMQALRHAASARLISVPSASSEWKSICCSSHSSGSCLLVGGWFLLGLGCFCFPWFQQSTWYPLHYQIHCLHAATLISPMEMNWTAHCSDPLAKCRLGEAYIALHDWLVVHPLVTSHILSTHFQAQTLEHYLHQRVLV